MVLFILFVWLQGLLPDLTGLREKVGNACITKSLFLCLQPIMLLGLAGEKSGRGNWLICPRSYIRRLLEATQEVKART